MFIQTDFVNGILKKQDAFDAEDSKIQSVILNSVLMSAMFIKDAMSV